MKNNKIQMNKIWMKDLEALENKNKTKQIKVKIVKNRTMEIIINNKIFNLTLIKRLVKMIKLRQRMIQKIRKIKEI